MHNATFLEGITVALEVLPFPTTQCYTVLWLGEYGSTSPCSGLPTAMFITVRIVVVASEGTVSLVEMVGRRCWFCSASTTTTTSSSPRVQGWWACAIPNTS